MRRLTACLLGLAVAGCSKDTRPFKAPVKLAGKTVPAETLNLGRTADLQYCRACHGDQGKGDGPSAPGLRPPDEAALRWRRRSSWTRARWWNN